MVDVSIIEYGIYGFICYFSLAMMIILSIKDNIPHSLTNSGVRILFMFPGLICAVLLTGGFEEIVMMETIVTNSTGVNITNSTETIKIQDYTTFSNVHLMIFLIIFIWIVYQSMMILQRAGKRSNE